MGDDKTVPYTIPYTGQSGTKTDNGVVPAGSSQSTSYSGGGKSNPTGYTAPVVARDPSPAPDKGSTAYRSSSSGGGWSGTRGGISDAERAARDKYAGYCK